MACGHCSALASCRLHSATCRFCVVRTTRTRGCTVLELNAYELTHNHTRCSFLFCFVQIKIPAMLHTFSSMQTTRCDSRHIRRQAPANTSAVHYHARAVTREVLMPGERQKLDSGDDRDFYSFPRLVKHVDDPFLRQVTELYRQLIPPGGAVLDLCSSWVSHLPSEVHYSKVVGHGMNASELSRNERLDSFFVRNLNVEPSSWAQADNSFDAVLCCVSIQYMQQPEKVLAEVQRVLKPGGWVIITFSNRQFYNKAISAWRDNTGFGRVQLVKSYIRAVEGFADPKSLTEVPGAADKPMVSLPGPLKFLERFLARTSSDPFYAVIAQKQ